VGVLLRSLGERGCTPAQGRRQTATSRDYENTRQVAVDGLGHSRISLPYDLILIGH
jgi:hypothetical protein